MSCADVSSVQPSGGFVFLEGEGLNNDNIKTGYIKLYRSVQNNWVWKDRFYKEAWVDLLLWARGNPEPKEMLIKNRLLICYRGQLLRSEETLATAWGVNRSKVHRLLKLLQKCTMIELVNEQVTSRITIVNYDSYNPLRIDNEQDLNGDANKERTLREQRAHINNKDKKANKGNKETKYSVGFERFWSEYPKKVKKEDSYIEWKKLNLDSMVDEIIEKLIAIKAGKDAMKNANEFTANFPDPERWIKRKRWNDEVEVPTVKPTPKTVKKNEYSVPFPKQTVPEDIFD